jgi:hypothetical protein
MNRNVANLSMTELEDEHHRLARQQDAVRKSLDELAKQLRTVAGEIERRKRVVSEPHCTDHALVRYMQRKYGIPVEDYRAEIMSPTTKASIKVDAKSVMVNGIKMIISEGKVITCYEPSEVRELARKKDVRDRNRGPSVDEGLSDYFDEIATELVR